MSHPLSTFSAEAGRMRRRRSAGRRRRAEREVSDVGRNPQRPRTHWFKIKVDYCFLVIQADSDVAGCLCEIPGELAPPGGRLRPDYSSRVFSLWPLSER